MAFGTGLIFHDPEVEHLQEIVLGSQPGDEEVGRLDVTMHESVLMRLGERSTRLPQKHDHAIRDLRSEALHDLMEGETLQQLHDVFESTGVIYAIVVELH